MRHGVQNMSRLTVPTIACCVIIPQIVVGQASFQSILVPVAFFQREFGWTGVPWGSPGDFNGDGSVDLLDYLSYFNTATGQSSPPCDPPICADADMCTIDVCIVGVCQHFSIPNCCTSAAQCVDADPCTADLCLGFSCAHREVQAGTPCNDGSKRSK